jgi:hypothetical protein
MTIKRSFTCRCLLGALVVLTLLLNGPSQMLWAQSAPTGESTRQDEPPPGEEAPSEDTATAREQPPQDRGRAYRKQKDNLKPFEPSEEIRVDKTVDFPADI